MKRAEAAAAGGDVSAEREGYNKERQNRVCRFFSKGNCHKGNNCRFLHGASALEPSTSGGPASFVAEIRQPAPEVWVNAPEFVPSLHVLEKLNAEAVSKQLCPHTDEEGRCPRLADGNCNYLHGDICDTCGCACLDPQDEEKRMRHEIECRRRHDREIALALQRSKEKSCGICFEVIMEKSSQEQRFGILPNCKHCFCLSCIRRWRQSRQFEHRIVRACPECRTTSDFVCPSMFWVDSKEDKKKLIVDYKDALSKKDCKYFKQGRGKCPFGNKCFYMHALPDGTKTDVGPPPPRQNNHALDFEFLQQIILIGLRIREEDQHQRYYSLSDDIGELVEIMSRFDENDIMQDFEQQFED